MSRYHRGAPLYRIKNQIEQDFGAWCMGNKEEVTPRNLIEWLVQKNFLQGREFLEYCDSVPLPMFGSWNIELCCSKDMLREGLIPPDAWIGHRKGKKNEDQSRRTGTVSQHDRSDAETDNG